MALGPPVAFEARKHQLIILTDHVALADAINHIWNPRGHPYVLVLM